MLVLKESPTSDILHNFDIIEEIVADKISFKLGSDTYPEYNFDLKINHAIHHIPPGFTVSVHLFKNPFYAQRDIIEIKVREIEANNGRIGYLLNLHAIFDEEAIELTKYNFPYVYYGIKALLSQSTSFQTKQKEIGNETLIISDFFHEDIIIAIVCNEYANVLPNFDIENYLASLYTLGFFKVTPLKNIESYNQCQYVKDKFLNLKSHVRSDGVFSIKVKTISPKFSEDNFTTMLFSNLLLTKTEVITRFVTLYQIIEISIAKIFHLKIQQRVCSQLGNLTSLQLKKFLGEIQTEKYRITLLMHEFGKPENLLKQALKKELVQFFQHIQDADYSLPEEDIEALDFSDIFYDYRNKLFHSYRLIHNQNVDNETTIRKMKDINDLTEILIAQILINFE